MANATRGLGIALDTQGSFEESLRLFEEAVALLRELDDRRHLASALLNLGVGLARHGGDPERATALYEEALGLYRELGNALSMAHCLVNLGNRAKATGHLALAESRYREAAELARPLDSPFHLGVALVGLGDIARLGGDAVAAGERYREALRLFGAAGERQAVAVCLRFLGWFAWATGRPERAARLYGAGEALWPGAAAADGDEEEARLHAGAQHAAPVHPLRDLARGHGRVPVGAAGRGPPHAGGGAGGGPVSAAVVSGPRSRARPRGGGRR